MEFNGKEYELRWVGEDNCSKCSFYPYNSEPCLKGRSVENCDHGAWKEVKSDWKPLEKDNLPPDILVGDYEVEKEEHKEWSESPTWMDGGRLQVLGWVKNNVRRYRYRLKPKPKCVLIDFHDVMTGKIDINDYTDVKWNEGDCQYYGIKKEWKDIKLEGGSLEEYHNYYDNRGPYMALKIGRLPIVSFDDIKGKTITVTIHP